MSAPAFHGRLALAVSLPLFAIYVPLLLLFWAKPQPLWDFSMFWMAGRLTLAGNAAAAYDWVQVQHLLALTFGEVHSDYARTFFYPPAFLVVLAPLAALPFALAAALWLAGNLAAYLAAMRAILPGRSTLPVMAAAPVVLFNFSFGQNGLLSAGLLGGGLVLLDRRPVLAGLLIGLLAYKPNLGLLLPLYLAATGRWRVFAAAAATVLVSTALAAVLFGSAPYAAFLALLGAANGAFVRHGELAGAMQWSGVTSLYAVLRLSGCSAVAAAAAQLALAATAVVAVLRLAVGGAGQALQAAALATAAILATPYAEVNDLAVLMVGWAFLVRDGIADGFGPAEKPLLAIVFVMPLGWLLLQVLRLPGFGNWCAMGLAMGALLALVIGARRMRPKAVEVAA